jgi:hypothetical protein
MDKPELMSSWNNVLRALLFDKLLTDKPEAICAQASIEHINEFLYCIKTVVLDPTRQQARIETDEAKA